MKEIQLTQGKVALVDDADYEKVMAISARWQVHKDWNTYYARTFITENGKKRTILMHRAILGVEDTGYPLVDHVDHDGLNNTRSNIRLATTSQNSTNRVCAKVKYQYRGVRQRADGLWVYRFYENGKRRIRGGFRTEEQAAKAFDRKAKEVYGEFAVLNFPEER